MINEVQETQKDPKLAQFTEELNVLLENYQYALKVQLRITTDGIVPVLAVVNSVPSKKVKQTKKVKQKKGKK